MRSLPFRSELPGDLRAWLQRPLLRVSSQPRQGSGPHAITLWSTATDGVQIVSAMHDLAPRIEVGVLEFTLRNAVSDGEVFDETPALPRTIQTTEKLVITVSKTRCESGIVLRSADGQEIVICAGALPYSLAVLGLFGRAAIAEPEYDLADYQRVSLETRL